MNSMNSMAAMGPVMMIIWLAVVVFYLICSWKIYQKAGKPGWASIVPIYNIVVLCQIAGKSGWWTLLLIIPIVNIIILIILMHGLSKNFGKGVGTTLGLIFLSPIFIPILAFSKAAYVGAKK